MQVQQQEHRAGYIAVIGRPNAGKSTLIDKLIGEKAAIVSDRPQTTRNRILCILSTERPSLFSLIRQASTNLRINWGSIWSKPPRIP